MSVLRRRGSMGGKTDSLPSEYQRVEYIGTGSPNSVGQYIDTGISPSSSWSYSMRFRMKGQYASKEGFFGGKQSEVVLQRYASSTPKLRALWSGIGTQAISDVIDTSMPHTVKLNGTGAYLDGVRWYQFAGQTFTGQSSLLVCASRKTDGSVDVCADADVYDFRITSPNGAIMHLIPCYRKSDNVIGMFDTVSRSFFTNAGTGTFTKGADV